MLRQSYGLPDSGMNDNQNCIDSIIAGVSNIANGVIGGANGNGDISYRQSC